MKALNRYFLCVSTLLILSVLNSTAANGSLISKARTAVEEGDNSLAIDLYTQLIEANPTMWEAYLERGFLYEIDDEYEAELAIEDYDKAIELHPTSDAYLRRGSVYVYEYEYYDKAIDDLTKSVSLDSENFDAYFSRGQAYIGAEDYLKAILDFNICLKLDDEMFQTYAERGYCYLMLGEYDKALADYDYAELKNSDEWGEYLYGKGLVYKAQGRYDEAIAQFEAVIKRCPAEYMPHEDSKYQIEEIRQLR